MYKIVKNELHRFDSEFGVFWSDAHIPWRRVRWQSQRLFFVSPFSIEFQNEKMITLYCFFFLFRLLLFLSLFLSLAFGNIVPQENDLIYGYTDRQIDAHSRRINKHQRKKNEEARNANAFIDSGSDKKKSISWTIIFAVFLI